MANLMSYGTEHGGSAIGSYSVEAAFSHYTGGKYYTCTLKCVNGETYEGRAEDKAEAITEAFAEANAAILKSVLDSAI